MKLMKPSDEDADEGVLDDDPQGDEPQEIPDECREALRRVAIYSTRPGRKVFVERGNTDRWISTDEAVDVVE